MVTGIRKAGIRFHIAVDTANVRIRHSAVLKGRGGPSVRLGHGSAESPNYALVLLVNRPRCVLAEATQVTVVLPTPHLYVVTGFKSLSDFSLVALDEFRDDSELNNRSHPSLGAV